MPPSEPGPIQSRSGALGAILFLLLLPLAALVSAVFEAGVEFTIHLLLAAGALLVAASAADFAVASWFAWIGRASAGLLGLIFALQAIAELRASDELGRIAYGALGQGLEAWLGRVFLFWCGGVALAASRGRIRILGLLAVGMALAAEVVALVLSSRGSTLNEAAPALRILSLLPFVWLLAESLKRRGDPRLATLSGA